MTLNVYGPIQVSRRLVLASGLAGAVACISGPLAARCARGPQVPLSCAGGGSLWVAPGLYAFPGDRDDTVALVVKWPNTRPGAGRDAVVRVHAGSRAWSVPTKIDPATGAADPVVLNVRVAELVAGGLPVRLWAERERHGGPRERLGSPLLTPVLAESPALEAVYHRIHPGQDRQVMSAMLADAIAQRAARHGRVADAAIHGRRLAAKLLPDVLYFDPTSPCGFTFAERNGRHPCEHVEAVVDSILNGLA